MGIVQEDLKKLLENPVLIYGAGRGAFKLIQNLKALNVNIIGLAVSDISDKRTLGYDGYKVQIPELYKAQKDTAMVLIATSEKYHEEIKSKCRQLGYKNIIASSPELLELVSIEAHKVLFEIHKLPFEGDVITIGNGKYLNPYSEIFPHKFGVVDQWEDICSTLFGDMSMSYEGPYEYDNVHISKGDIVLDFGANIGYVSVYAASKGATVYAFEPNSENHSLIKRHSQLNEDRIYLEPYAVSDKCGTATLWINKAVSAGSSLNVEIGGGTLSTSVPQITVDEFVNQKGLKSVDYIHANIMGFERFMLKGAQETLKKFAPKIVVCAYEYHDDKEVLSDLILKGNPSYKIENKCGKLYAYV